MHLYFVTKFHHTSYSKFRQNMKKQGGKVMKATGVVRRIDDLGRVVIPKEIRKTLRIKERRSTRNIYRQRRRSNSKKIFPNRRTI